MNALINRLKTFMSGGPRAMPGPLRPRDRAKASQSDVVQGRIQSFRSDGCAGKPNRRRQPRSAAGPLIEGFFGGRLAHELEAAGRDAFFDFAAAEVVDLFGSGFALACACSSKPAGGAILSRWYPVLRASQPCGRACGARRACGWKSLFCRRGVLAARFHDGARRLSDRYRSRRRSDRAESPGI